MGFLSLRYKLPETPVFLDNQHHPSEANPKRFRTIFSNYKKGLLCSIALISVASVTAGFSTAFLNIIFTQDLSFELHKSLLIISFGLVFYIIGSLFSSYLL